LPVSGRLTSSEGQLLAFFGSPTLVMTSLQGSQALAAWPGRKFFCQSNSVVKHWKSKIQKSTSLLYNHICLFVHEVGPKLFFKKSF
jgi:hypothetical protein